VSSSWFLGDCAVLQVDDRCKIFRLSLSNARTASLSLSLSLSLLARSVRTRVSHFYARRVYASVICTCVCVRVCGRGWVRSRVRAGANEIGEIRSARNSADGGCRPSLSDSPAYRVVVVVVSLSTAPRRTAPLRIAARHVESRLREKRSADERITRKLVGDRPGRSSVHRA